MEPENIDNSDRLAISTKSRIKKNQHPAAQAKQIKEDLFKVDREIGKISAELLSGEKVFFLGLTGAGKSTLMNFIINNNLEADKEGKLDTKDPVKGSEIGHETTSKTASPSLCVGPNNMVLVDFPGFGDTEGSQKDLEHAYARHKWFSGPFKILLAVKEKDLEGKALELLKLMKALTKTIPVEELKESLALVVTKQGWGRNFSAHKALKRILERNAQTSTAAFPEDVKTLLLHLTEETNIKIRVPYFPYPNIVGEYKPEEVRENILTSINSLKPMVNPKVQMQLSPESTLLVSQLAKDLNQDVEHSIETILRPKVVQLCKQYTNAYASDDSISGLKHALQTIRSALSFLEKDSMENLGRFADSFDGFFAQDDNNVVKECVKTLMFLQTLQQDTPCSTKAWAHVLQPTLNDIHELIDSLAKRLFGKITTYLEVSTLSVMECCKILPETTTGEQEIEVFTQKLQDLTKATRVLQEAAPENMVNVIHLGDIVGHNSAHEVKNHFKTLKLLSTLKPIEYPKGDWSKPLNSSAAHIKTEIDRQQKILDLKKSLEEEHLRHEEEAKIRKALEEEARNEREESIRKTEKQHRDHLAELEEQHKKYTLLQDQLVQQKEEALLLQKAETEKLREEEKALKTALEKAQKDQEATLKNLKEAERQWLAEKNQTDEQRKVQEAFFRTLTENLATQTLTQATILKQIEVNKREAEELRQQQKHQAEKALKAQEELTTKIKFLETKAEADRQALATAVSKKDLELQTLQARVVNIHQATAQQIAEANQKNAQHIELVRQENQKLKQQLTSPVKPQANQPVNPVGKTAVKPQANQPVNPVGKTAVKPQAKQPVKPVVKTAVKPQANQPVNPVGKTAVKPQAKQPVNPVGKTAVKPQAKQPVNPVGKTAVKPQVKTPVKAVVKTPLDKGVANK